MSYIYVALILRLRVADNLTRKKLLVLSVTVEAANLLYAYTTLLCDAHERLARLNLVVKLFSRRTGRISAYFATVNLLSGVTTVANLATGSVSFSILALVTVTLEIVEIACNILVAEIEEQGWVQCHTTETGLEKMEPWVEEQIELLYSYAEELGEEEVSALMEQHQDGKRQHQLQRFDQKYFHLFTLNFELGTWNFMISPTFCVHF